MKKLNIPHQEPLHFAKSIVSKNAHTALVSVSFSTPPTLPMLIESAAQSSGAFNIDASCEGFLVMMKDIHVHQDIKYTEYTIEIILQNELEKLKYFTFKVKKDKQVICTGSLVISLS
ncbi:hypothetical protein JHD48_03165 [Sulfurimonas sp. SAG-AH-194-I05]|nr:hypothetical protein [Sulfurimonas sp. SAG-AH-194-I05]MDF1874733.1 hypothetical protein [Sulfurimonas sp. SAG-AH-194-I05]